MTDSNRIPNVNDYLVNRKMKILVIYTIIIVLKIFIRRNDLSLLNISYFSKLFQCDEIRAIY